jgi:hypothetical protein
MLHGERRLLPILKFSKCLCKCYMVKEDCFPLSRYQNVYVNVTWWKKTFSQNVYVNVTWWKKTASHYQDIKMFMWMLHGERRLFPIITIFSNNVYVKKMLHDDERRLLLIIKISKCLSKTVPCMVKEDCFSLSKISKCLCECYIVKEDCLSFSRSQCLCYMVKEDCFPLLPFSQIMFM